MKLNESVFKKFPVLETKRLVLTEITHQAGEAIYKMRSNGMVNRFIPRPTMETIEQGEELAQNTQEAFYAKKAIGWAGILKGQGEVMGTCGFNSIDFYNLRAEIGGEMDVKYWGKNIAQEAVEAIIYFGFNTLNLHTIEAKVAPQNRGAVFVLQQLGFVQEALFKDRVYYKEKFDDMAVFTLHRGNENYPILDL
ncbi:MAG: GNAT family N-acetyltransferase [Salibacteraceae bacterium]